MNSFTHATLGATGLSVHRLGLSASYRPGKAAIRRAIDAGINLFFAYGVDSQMTSVLSDVFRRERERFVLATGAYNWIVWYPNLRRTMEKRLRQFHTDHIDLFLFLGVTKETHLTGRTREELHRLKEEGKVRFVGMSCHDRRFAGKLASEGLLDLFMIRYNAAHRGAEQDIFPHLALHDPGVIAYTATRWHALLTRPKGWPREERIPTAGDAYRFVLSNPHVHACLTAPTNIGQLNENIAALEKGPLDAEEMAFMTRFGDAVYNRKKFFM